MRGVLSGPALSALVLGLAIGAGAASIILGSSPLNHDHPHPIADPADDEYHVHADFHIVIAGERLDLADPALMTTGEQELHPDVHLHDGNGEVQHLHAPGVTFAEFLASLGIELTNECLTVDEQEYCADETNELRLYVDGTQFEDNLTTYEPVDDEQILLYYGQPDAAAIETALEAVPDDACYYSGTCPERGVAPPESCGLTCDL